jgi:hypothetical protein
VLLVLKENRVLKDKRAPVDHREFRELKGSLAHRVSLLQKPNF